MSEEFVTMKAAVYYGPRDVRVEEVERPAAGAGEVVVRVLRCAVCGTPPKIKASRHAFFKLSDFKDRIEEWLEDNINPEIANELRSKWLEPGLRDWDFTRDAPYFGFEVPGHEGLYFYVWWDAPIGYFASLENYCREKGMDLRKDWIEAGVKIVISTDAHRAAELDYMRYGLDQARRGWLEKEDVANTYPTEAFLGLLDR